MSKIITLKSGDSAQLNPLCSGFAHGFGIFETIRLSNGQLEFWRAHYQRFLYSAKTFNLHLDQAEEAVLEAIRELIQAEELRDGIVKLSLLREGTDVRCYVYTRPIYLPEEPVKLHLDIQSRLNQHSILAGHKTHNYMEAIYLKQMAQNKGFFDVVRFSTDGFLAETAVANLFFVEDDTLLTPALSTGILPGVIRSEVLHAAKKHSINAEEGQYALDSLKTAEAVFLTNSSVGVLPVCLIDAGDSNITYSESHPIVDSLKSALADAKERKSVKLNVECRKLPHEIVIEKKNLTAD